MVCRILTRPGGLGSVLLLFILVGSCCAPIARRNNIDFYREHPQTFLRNIERNTQSLQTLAGSANLTVESAAGSYNGYADIYYVAPDSLKIKLRAMLGIQAAVVAITGETLQLYLPRQKTLYRCNIQSLNWSSLLGMPLDARQIFLMVTGLPHVPEEVFPGEVPMEINGKYLLFRWFKDGQERRYYIDPRQSVISMFTLTDEKSECIWRLELRRFKTISKVRIPHHIQLIHLPEKERVSLYYRWIKVNRPIKAERFKIKLPDDVKIVSLSS